MIDELQLLSGIDVPFYSAHITIHQPTLKEIAFIGEENFFTGTEILKFSKKSLVEDDKEKLKSKSDFNIIMKLINEEKNPLLKKHSVGAKMVLALMLPDYVMRFQKNERIILLKENDETFKAEINSNNYGEFQEIIKKMYCLGGDDSQEYNPQGDLAKKIADKLKKGAQKRASLNGDFSGKYNILSKFVSILATGSNISINEIMNYTVYQLYDHYQRYVLKINYDLYQQSLFAGAKNPKEVDHWMKDLYKKEKE